MVRELESVSVSQACKAQSMHARRARARAPDVVHMHDAKGRVELRDNQGHVGEGERVVEALWQPAQHKLVHAALVGRLRRQRRRRGKVEVAELVELLRHVHRAEVVSTGGQVGHLVIAQLAQRELAQEGHALLREARRTHRRDHVGTHQRVDRLAACLEARQQAERPTDGFDGRVAGERFELLVDAVYAPRSRRVEHEGSQAFGVGRHQAA